MKKQSNSDGLNTRKVWIYRQTVNVIRFTVITSICTLLILLLTWLKSSVVNTSYEFTNVTPVRPARAAAIKQNQYKARIREVCDRISNGYYVHPRKTKPENSVLRTLVDHYHQVVYCSIPKVATDSWFYLFKSVFEKEEAARRDLFSLHMHYYEPYVGLGISQLSRGNKSHTEVEYGIPDPRKQYFKFIVVRHPLERLGSAWMNKLGSGKKNGMRADVQRMKAIANNRTTWDRDVNVNVTFEEFLTYAAGPDVQLSGKFDSHFRSYQGTCEPCSIDYDYIAHLETLSEDLPFILPHLNATDFSDHFPTVKLRDTSDTRHAHLFRNAPFPLVKAVIDKCRPDADMFGYSFDGYVREADRSKIAWL